MALNLIDLQHEAAKGGNLTNLIDFATKPTGNVNTGLIEELVYRSTYSELRNGPGPETEFLTEGVILRCAARVADVRIGGSAQVVRGLPLAQHINAVDAAPGRRCSLGKIGDVVYVLAVFLGYADEGAAYVSRSVELVAPTAAATARDNGYLVRWSGLARASAYELLGNDDDSGQTPRRLYIGPAASALVSYAELCQYFAVRGLAGDGTPGDLSDWVWGGWPLTEGTIQDKFDGYGGTVVKTTQLDSLWWLRFVEGSFENLWGGISADTNLALSTSHVVEGQYSLMLTAANSLGALQCQEFQSPALNFSQEGRFTDDDYILLHCYLPQAITGLQIVMTRISPSGGATFTLGAQTAGEYFFKFKRSEAVLSGGFDWSVINNVLILANGTATGHKLYHDDLRIAKADPDDAATFNDTGASWDFAASTGSDVGIWHIYEGNRTGEPTKPYSLGQIKSSAAVWYLAHKPFEQANIVQGTIQAGVYLKAADGKAGLAWFIQETAAGAWEMYALEADSSANTVTLVKWVAGARSVIASASFAFGYDALLWLGVDFRDYGPDQGRLKVYASLSEGNTIQAANLVISTQDLDPALMSGGSVGLLCYDCNTRFVSFIAGSPQHADVADVANALNGPILGGGGAAWATDISGHLVGASFDIRPYGDQRGLGLRFIQPLGTPTEHFRSGSIPAGYSWAATSGVMYGTPGTLIYSQAGEYLIALGGGAGQKHFLQKAVANSGAAWQNNRIATRCYTRNGCLAGVRVDNGNSGATQPYIELYLEDSGVATGTVKFRYRNTVGGATTTVTGPVISGQYVTLYLLLNYSGGVYTFYAYLVLEDGLTHTLGNSGAVAWMPVAGRVGIFLENASNYSSFDWFWTTF